MAIRRIAPIKKKKTLAINNSGSLFISTSKKDDDKRNPRVYIASSSPSVPLTELKFNELDADKRKQYSLLFNQEVDPVGFINVFQNVVSNNLLQSINKKKDTVLNEINDFITATAEVLVVAVAQQNVLYTPDEIQQKQSDLDVVIETITEAQTQQTTSLGDRVLVGGNFVTAPPPPPKAETSALNDILEAQKRINELSAVDPKYLKVDLDAVEAITLNYKNEVDQLQRAGFKQAGPDLWVSSQGEQVQLKPLQDRLL